MRDLLAGYVPGGWRDWWDDPDDSAELRARGEETENRLTSKALVLGRVWQREVADERQHAEREWSLRRKRQA